MPLRPQRRNIICLILRQHLSTKFINPDMGSNRFGRAPAVAGQHNGLLYPKPAQSGKNVRHLLPQRIGDADDSRQLPVDCQIQMGVFQRQGVELFLLSGWNRTAFVLKNKVGAADEHTLLPDKAGNPMRHQVIHLRVELFVFEATALCFLHNGVGHRVGKMLFQAGRQPQHLRFLVPAEWYHPGYPGTGAGQGAGLIEYHRIGLGDLFQKLPALYRDMLPAGLTHGGEYGQRHGELQRAGKVHHQHR